MARTEFAVAQRKVAVAAHTLVEDQHVSGAVHRLERVVALFRFGGEHQLPVVLPVAGSLPEAARQHHRPAHFLIAAVAIDLAHVLLDLLPQRPALGVPEDHSRRVLLHVEQVELRAELAVVALLGLLEHLQVGVLVFLLRPCGAVDPLQHFVLRVAAPVRAGDAHQLEHLELAGRRHMRAAAQVGEIALCVQRDLVVRRNRSDDFRLVGLALVAEEFHGLVARHFLALHRQVALRDLGHARLDRGEILGCERPAEREVVVEAVFDHRPDRHLRLRKQLLDRMRK